MSIEFGEYSGLNIKIWLLPLRNASINQNRTEAGPGVCFLDEEEWRRTVGEDEEVKCALL